MIAAIRHLGRLQVVGERTRVQKQPPSAAASCPGEEWRARVDEDDGVDGPCSPASRCPNVVDAERHNERSRPLCKLPRWGWISRRECFRFMASTPPVRSLFVEN